MAARAVLASVPSVSKTPPGIEAAAAEGMATAATKRRYVASSGEAMQQEAPEKQRACANFQHVHEAERGGDMNRKSGEAVGRCRSDAQCRQHICWPARFAQGQHACERQRVRQPHYRRAA
jgi:hypothetical protein